ncbi:MAG TPA: fructosamine kinase family protein [Allosphingosinicella sp.]|uniref:fructosamine kinase family protein n=1 Tax=Allosphingosinicella sp. TaxID=2823234 RepID=UPI002F28C234
MTAFAQRVAELVGVGKEHLERLAGGDLSEVLLFRRPDGRCTVAKGGPGVSTEAAMLRLLASIGVPTAPVEGEHQDVLLLERVENDGVFSPKAWASIGEALRQLHEHLGEGFGWPVDYALGSVALDNRETPSWPRFWAERRLIATASVLDRPWRERVERVAAMLDDLLPAKPPAALLHGDLWTGNILVAGGRLAALIDPACYHGHAEVDLAMLTLFDTPGDSFWESYGSLEPGWEVRRSAYQLFPALVHLRLFGASYAGMVDRLLAELGT